MDSLQKGDHIRITYKDRKKIVKKEYIVESNHRTFLVVTNGMYRDTIDKYLVKNGTIKLQIIECKEVDNMAREKKITREQLLDECRTHDITKESIVLIAQKYGLSPLTLKTYINKMKIKKELTHTEQQPTENIASIKKNSLRPLVFMGKVLKFDIQNDCIVINQLEGPEDNFICISFEEYSQFKEEVLEFASNIPGGVVNDTDIAAVG